MASLYVVDVEDVPHYVKYFDILLIPSVIFFFNGVHLKCDYGTPDHTKWVGHFHSKEDFISLIESFYLGAMKGKQIIDCPLEKTHVPKYELIYNEI
jgi:hypothetical protein